MFVDFIDNKLFNELGKDDGKQNETIEYGSKGGKRLDLSLPGEPMDLFEPGPCYASFENTVILLCIDVERFFVDWIVIVNLVYGGILITMLLGERLMVLRRRGLSMTGMVMIEV